MVCTGSSYTSNRGIWVMWCFGVVGVPLIRRVHQTAGDPRGGFLSAGSRKAPTILKLSNLVGIGAPNGERKSFKNIPQVHPLSNDFRGSRREDHQKSEIPRDHMVPGTPGTSDIWRKKKQRYNHSSKVLQYRIVNVCKISGSRHPFWKSLGSKFWAFTRNQPVLKTNDHAPHYDSSTVVFVCNRNWGKLQKKNPPCTELTPSLPNMVTVPQGVYRVSSAVSASLTLTTITLDM